MQAHPVRAAWQWGGGPGRNRRQFVGTDGTSLRIQMYVYGFRTAFAIPHVKCDDLAFVGR